MSLKYSCFISYRRNEHETKYISNLKDLLQSESFRVTNRPSAFFDEESIRFGECFDSKIYEGIENSYFFMAIWYLNYLHEDNTYCARELLHAISIEQQLRNLIPENEQINFCYVIPFLFRGQIEELPNCFKKKLTVDIRKFEYAITNNIRSNRIIAFVQKLYNDLSSYYRIFNDYITKEKYQEICDNIEKPTEEFVKEWISLQKSKIKNLESHNLPILKKTDE